MTTETSQQPTFTIEFSLDGGETWQHGMTRPAFMRGSLDDFRSVVRHNQRRHGRGVKTRVIDEPTVTPDPKPSCSVARFGRPHAWTVGAFYWPLGATDSKLYVGDDYAMCGLCGQIEAE